MKRLAIILNCVGLAFATVWGCSRLASRIFADTSQSTFETIVGWILNVLLYAPYSLTLVVMLRNNDRTWRRLALIANVMFALLLVLLTITGLNWDSQGALGFGLLIVAIGLLPFALNILVLWRRSQPVIASNAG